MSKKIITITRQYGSGGREIGEKLSLPRRTVNNRRQRAYELLKKLMGGDEDA